jgi:hypothetical protein
MPSIQWCLRKLPNHVKAVDSEGNSLVALSVVKGDLFLVKFFNSFRTVNFLELVNWLGQTCLHLACKEGQHEMVKYILTCGRYFDIDQMCSKGYTAFSYAVLNNQFDVAFLLLDFGCDPNVSDDGNKSCILLCAEKGNRQAFEWLLDQKLFDIFEEDIDNNGILHYAAQNYQASFLEWFCNSSNYIWAKRLNEMVNNYNETALKTACVLRNKWWVKKSNPLTQDLSNEFLNKSLLCAKILLQHTDCKNSQYSNTLFMYCYDRAEATCDLDLLQLLLLKMSPAFLCSFHLNSNIDLVYWLERASLARNRFRTWMQRSSDGFCDLEHMLSCRVPREISFLILTFLPKFPDLTNIRNFYS